MTLAIAKTAIRERFTHDLKPLRAPAATGAFAATKWLLGSSVLERRAAGYRLLMRLYSSGFASSRDGEIARVLHQAISDERAGVSTGLDRLITEAVQATVSEFRRGPNPDPKRLVGSRILVVKPFLGHERGAIVVDYSYVFPLLEGLFDLRRIAERYDIVLEPSWAGCCAPEILLFTRVAHPVFVETVEPRDQAFLAQLGTNVRSVPLAANWWVDHRLTPPPAAARDIDVIMVASWSEIKRHWRVFRALAALRARGHRLRTALVGYELQHPRAYVESLAAHFGISDQIEIHERISQDEVAALLSRSKVHVLWSRRECANRAIIEAMMADVPVLVREGLTFGFRYPYINDRTGRFIKEHELEDAIIDVIQNRGRFAPRDWVIANMTCELATGILEDHLRREAEGAGQPWTQGLTVKTASLDVQRYWNPDDESRFKDDYAFLTSAIRPTPS